MPVNLIQNTPGNRRREACIKAFARSSEYAVFLLAAFPTAALNGLAAVSGDAGAAGNLHTLCDLKRLLDEAGTGGFVKSQSMLYFVRPFNERLSETTGMNCPHCDSSVTKGLKKLTSLGYKQFVCSDCGKQFNQRSGTALNFIMYPTDVVRTVVQYYYQFKVSLHDVVALMVMRGFHVTHQTVHNWVHRFGPALGMRLRARRYQKSNDRWHVDCTYLRIEGRWCYFYRAIDEKGDLIDVYLSDVRDQQAAENFFKQAAKTSGIYPEQITTDKEPALYPAIQAVFGEYTDHRDNNYLNNRIEQSHRGIKSRMRVMKGFKNIFCALRFCTVFEEIQQFFRETNKNLRTILSKFQTFNQLFQQAF